LTRSRSASPARKSPSDFASSRMPR
jgi:hypothetical protein